ncbi:MAG: class I SAM-dependent methyltransferase [Sphingomonas sp.]
MTEATGESPDTIRADDWAGEQGDKWLANLDRFESMIAPVGDALFARAGFAPGERAIDVGCGGGATTLAIARAVAPGGAALGLDISPALIAASARRAAAEGVAGAAFVCADAATATPEGAPFDRLFSRFGSMFFPEPEAAFANLRAMLRPGGRVDLAVWAPVRENGWMMEMMAVVAAQVTLPPPRPRAPGPFAFGETGYLREVLAAAGFGTPDIVAWEGLQPIGGAGATPAEAVAFVTGATTLAAAIADVAPETRARIAEGLAALFSRHHVAGRGVLLPGKAWLVTTAA